MIDEIRSALSDYTCNECQENGVCAEIDPLIPTEDYVIVKVDRYYNEEVPNPPPSTDCLITLKKSDDEFIHYVIELKDIKSPKGFTVDNVYNKFVTTLTDFMSEKFSSLYSDSIFPNQILKLYFVTDAYRLKKKGLMYEDIENLEGTKLERLILMPPIMYMDKPYIIKARTPNPIICKD